MEHTSFYDVGSAQWTQTHPNVESDLLMLAASFNRSPSAPEAFCLLHNIQWKINPIAHLRILDIWLRFRKYLM